MKEINKNNYCIHGKTLNSISINDWACPPINNRICQCCNNQLTYEEKQELGYDAKLCKVCLTGKIIMELL